MFSLLITIISIALVAALAVATIYYGGDAFKTAQTRAVAAAVVTQGQQVLGAVELFRVHQGRWPANRQELVDFGYLQSLPEPSAYIAMIDTPVGSVMSPAYAAAADAEWSQVQAGAPAFWILRNVSESVCREINFHVRKDNGIYNAALNQLTIQCFGDASNYTVLVHLPPQNPALELEVIVPANSGTPALQVDPSGNGWAKAPNQSESAAVPVITPSADVHYFDATTNNELSSWAFPDTLAGNTSVQKNFKVGNLGTNDLVFNNPPFVVGAPFYLSATTCAPVLPPGQYCTIGLTFTPSAGGAYSQSLTTSSNATGSTNFPLSGKGIGQATVSAFSPPSVSTLAGQIVTVTGANFSVGTVGYIGGVAAATVVNSPTSLTLTTPALTAGAYALTVAVPNAQVTQVAAQLQAVAAAPAIEVRDSSDVKATDIPFTSTVTGASSPAVTYNIVNTGTGDLVFGATPITVGAPFLLASTTCAGTLAANASCAISMTFNPAVVQNYSGNYLTVNSNATGVTLPTLSGSGKATNLTGAVTVYAGYGSEHFTVGPDSTSIYYVYNTTKIYVKTDPAAATQGVEQKITFTDTCNTFADSDADERFRYDDIAYDKATGSLFISGECAGSRAQFNRQQVMKVNMSNFTGAIVVSLARDTSEYMGQQYGLLTANKTGLLTLTTHLGYKAFRTSDYKIGGGGNWSTSGTAIALFDSSPGGTNSLITTLSSGNTVLASAQSGTQTVTGISSPARGWDVAENGYVYGGSGSLDVYKLSAKSGGKIDTATRVYTTSGYGGPKGKLVLAVDGTVFLYTGSSSGSYAHVQ